MKLYALLAVLPAALAVPGTISFKRLEPAPFAPATTEQGAFARCEGEDHHRANLAHPADMLDCLEISSWATANNGMWVLKATSTSTNTTTDDAGADDHDWHALYGYGNCALFVKYTEPTSVGNADVVKLIETIHMSDGMRLGPVEEVGSFCGCQAGVDVKFWLRGP
ncbi:hypothetical protein NPX13_g5888 [Xylaria arbuscula]|uniref:Ecp2 effector protein-like domain-containing protein n=1 Tax=Xylaria arbuscula TaxID=114810 RepID=A0A9W8NDL9_9PEZI|nr:hypothetical protein NPX13_g5888 [Xylaria arbuscula]